MAIIKANILGVAVDSLTMGEAVERAKGYIEEGKPRMIATANAEMIMRATVDDELRQILNAADLVVPDGAGTVWAANYLGYKMPERVAGYDLAQELMRMSAVSGYKLYFFGSAPGVADKAKAKAEEMYSGINICGTRNGFFDASDESSIVEDIKRSKPDILLAALGVPKQEKWLYAHMGDLGVPLSIGVGGTLDVMAGVMERAPLWMQKAKLEWLFRGLKQPSRAGRLMALPRFVLKVIASKKS